jgi:signal transduction histidine kinase
MGLDYLVAFQPTHSGAWSVLVFMPAPNESALIFSIWKTPIIFAATFVIILILAFFVGERVSEPIQNMVLGTRKLSGGDFSHRIEISIQDELGELGRAFNAMAEHLQTRESEILQRNQQLSSLNMIATTVNQSLDIEESLNSVLIKILEVTGATAGGIFLLKEKHTFHCQVHSGLTPEWSTHLFHPQKLGEGWIGTVAKSHDPMIWNDLPNLPPAASGDDLTDERGDAALPRPKDSGVAAAPPEIHRAGFRSYIILPLRFKKKVNGVICLLGDTPLQFDHKNVELLSSICNQIGVSIENARLFTNLENAYEELKATHAKLIQSAKLAAVGELAAGVAHELNQPLMVIRGYTQEILENSLQDLSEDLAKELKQIESQTTRMMKIINHLRAFARQSSGCFEVVDINDVVEKSFTLITQQLKTHNIAIILNLAPDLPRIWGDVTRLEQVFLNLITNARDAMEDRGSGTLTVSSRLIYTEKGMDKPISNEVEVVFSDTGSGIPQKHRDKIFDPFFTTKEVGKGTGLGLSIGYSIIKDHGGSIRAESRIGTGTSFILHFPVEKRRFPRRSGKGSEMATRRH